MMTREMVLMLAEQCGEDVEVSINNDGSIDLTFVDFIGFNEDWEEEFREYDNENAIDTLIEVLEKNCIEITKNLYVTYSFENFFVTVGFTSFDI